MSAGYSKAISTFEAAVREEMETWGLEGIAVAWVDGTATVHEAGFGETAADSVFRAGSVSKLFNAVAVMKLAERGRLDLDAPISPARLPANPFPGLPAVTLRQLLSHRSGLQRESAIGGYYDDSEPSLAATVAGLSGSVLVTPPGSNTRYSNIGPSLAGQLAVEASGEPSYSALQEDILFGPLGLTRSAWLRRDVPAGRMSGSYIRVADGRGGYARRAAPLFDLGTVPAGNLYTTAGDLARFMAMLAAGGDAPGGRVLEEATLRSMWERQAQGFGIGFAIGEWRGRRTVGHIGAVYGYSTALVWLPEAKIGAVVLCNEDIVSDRARRLTNLSLELMMQAKKGEAPPERPAFGAAAADLEALAGSWESQSFWLELAVDGGGLRGDMAGQPVALAPAAKDRFLMNSRIHNDVEIAVERDASGRPAALTAGPQRFERAPDRPPLPEEWRGYCGSYGPAIIPLVVFGRDGVLYATTENMVDYRLTPVNRHVFAFPPGMYAKEHLVFLPGPDGRAGAVDLANMRLERCEREPFTHDP